MYSAYNLLSSYFSHSTYLGRWLLFLVSWLQIGVEWEDFVPPSTPATKLKDVWQSLQTLFVVKIEKCSTGICCVKVSNAAVHMMLSALPPNSDTHTHTHTHTHKITWPQMLIVPRLRSWVWGMNLEVRQQSGNSPFVYAVRIVLLQPQLSQFFVGFSPCTWSMTILQDLVCVHLNSTWSAFIKRRPAFSSFILSLKYLS